MLNLKRNDLNGQEQATLAQLKDIRSESCDAAATFQREHMCSIHRGVLPGTISTLFGNDCFGTDLRCQVQVSKLVKSLEDEGINVVGFGLDEDEVTWVIEVDSCENVFLNDLLWSAWKDAVEELLGSGEASNA